MARIMAYKTDFHNAGLWQLKRLLQIVSLLMALISMPVLAHEFWIEAEKYALEPGEQISANLKVGQKFKGESLIYNPNDFIAFFYLDPDSDANKQKVKRDFNARLGDIPAIQLKAEKQGLHVLAYQSKMRELVYKDAATFTGFLKTEGIEWVLDEHKKRQLPEFGFTEGYHRYAKCIIKVGAGKGQDEAVGFPLEFVLQQNPYEAKESLTTRLLYQEKPFANSVVSLFVKTGADAERQYFKTDEEGNVTIPIKDKGVYLLSAVHMIESDEDTQQKTGAVWESLWASTTFEITE